MLYKPSLKCLVRIYKPLGDSFWGTTKQTSYSYWISLWQSEQSHQTVQPLLTSHCVSQQPQPNFLRKPPPPPCPIPSWKVLIHRTDNLIMRRTYYWYYAAEARLPWPPSERHLIFSPPSSLSMGPSVVENEFSLICMTDKHILYLSRRRSHAMDLGTRERERECEGVKWCVLLPLWRR